MKLKEKLTIGGMIFTLGTLFNVFFTAALHGVLSGRMRTLGLLPLWECVTTLFSDRQHLMLFLSFEGFLVLCVVLFFTQNDRSYQSNLLKVAEDIYTPAPVGQNQHGSARWLKEEEKDKVFGHFVLDPHNRIIAGLLSTAYDYDFMKKEADATAIQPLPSVSTPAQDEEDFPLPATDSETSEVLESATPPPSTMPEKDPYQLLDKAGIVVGMKKEAGGREKIYFIPNDTHALVLGATRSGKTRCLVLETICTLALAGESLVLSDPKAELYHYCSALLERLGYEVVCLDFKSPEKSSRYNLLQPVIDAVNRGDMEKAEMYAWDITNILVGDNVSQEKIWENGEKSTIAASILCVVVDNAKRPSYQNLTNVYWFIAEMCKSVGNKSPIVEYVKTLRLDHPARALLSISEVAPSRTRGSFYTSALTTLRLFTSKSIYHITKETDHDISQIGKRKQALFLILPDEKTTYYPIASLVVSQLYEILVRQSDERGGRLERRVNFVLDEFGNFAPLNDLPNKLTVAGGRGCRFQFYLQSFRQIESKYDEKVADIVKSNCENWVYLQADDKTSLQEISDKLGKYTCSAYQLSAQHGKFVNPSSSHSISLVGRELLMVDEVRRISRPYQIVISRSHPAMMTAPDLSQWNYNKLLGLGDPEHNRKVREERECKRKARDDINGEVALWGIWTYYTKDIQMQEERQKQRVFASQTGALFSERPPFFRPGGTTGED